MQRILIVEDEREMVRGLRDILEFEGYEVITAESGREGLQAVTKREPDCIILDLMLPDINGYQVCEEIRRQKRDTPIIMLTAKAQDYDKIRGLEVGADDYMTKPFSVGEFLARVKAILRRTSRSIEDMDVIRIGPSLVDVKHFRVRRGKKEHSLSHYEVELFKLLYENLNQPVSRDEILDRIWGTESYPTNRTVDNFIVKLRRKIEDDYKDPKHILTIYGVGYKLSP
ncbi:MAG: DNA-binding response regulator [Acidobacteria bacterium]|nr:MAG: DNA-binding response regulator [Acidobacteriota bacterium]PYV02789.1 MAG: DNA-binding response regulator [Acidobacteriota bacterium]PYV41139.1 MAG: DNA-binding response regulator [Acidobacteriota bacterium]